jgi:hypothetical protein
MLLRHSYQDSPINLYFVDQEIIYFWRHSVLLIREIPGFLGCSHYLELPFHAMEAFF